MAKIIGNTTATPTPRSDWNQTDETKADYIKNKPTILTEEDVMALIPSGSGGIPVVHELPTDAKDGDMYLYIPQNTLTSASGKRIYFDWEELLKPIDDSESTYFNFIAPDILNENITVVEAIISRHSDGYDLWIMTVSSDGKRYADLTISISNGVLDAEGSTLSIYDENGDTISSTSFNNIDELPLYFDIPEFSVRAHESLSGNAYLFHTDCRLMVYQGDLWSEITSLGSEVFTEEQLADLTANTEARHQHDNKDTLDKLGESDEILTYDGKKVVDSSVLAVVKEQKQLESLSDKSLLCYVLTDRIGFVPVALEAGVVYGGLADYKDRETIYIDPLLQNFFPCSAFTVTTEKVLLNEGGNEYCHYEFSTDGATYFYFKYFVNDEPFWVRLYNATDDMLIVDDITFPVGWSQYSVGDTEVAEIPIFTDSDYYMYFDVHSLKFSNDDYFNELQKVFSAERTYGSVRGYYQYYNSKWQKINFGRMSIISNSTPLTVDPTLSTEGAAADAKTTGDRLTDIEYQTVTTDLAFEHKDLPIGEKTVTVSGDGTWGNTVYVSSGEDLVPRTTFNRVFPYNGITVEKNGYTYHLSGTATVLSQICLTHDLNNGMTENVRGLGGKTLKLVGFADTILGEKVRIFIEFYNENKTNLSGQIKNPLFKSSTMGVKEIVVPENTAYMSISFAVTSGTTLDNDIQVYLNLAEKTQASTEFENIAVNDDESNYVMSFPYKSTVEVKAPIGAYIDYKTANAKGDTATYLTPEAFGAVGDGYTNDTEAVNACIAKAAETNQTVLMAKKYYITSPIDIPYDDMQIIINSVVYNGTESAVKIHGLRNTIKVQSIVSSGVGVAFVGENKKHITYNALEVNTIDSKSHGITFTTAESGSYQNTVRFNCIKAGGAGCYGIAYFDPSNIPSFGEDNFYGGNITNCEWACYGTRGNSKFYGIEIEGNVQGGFYIEGYTQIFHPRIAESQRDGNLPIYKFINTDNTTIYDSSGISINQIDLSEANETYITSGREHTLTENRMSKINGKIFARIIDGEDTIGVNYCRDAYIWGKYLIMTPFMAYRKEVATETLDTRLIGRTEETDEEICSLSQLPTKFVVNSTNTEIYLHESYCAFGFNEFEVEQANGFTCKIYDCKDNLIFDGTNQGDGLYRFNVYKDATYCASRSGTLRVDFMGHYWSVTKETTVDDVLAALPTWSGGAY